MKNLCEGKKLYGIYSAAFMVRETYPEISFVIHITPVDAVTVDSQLIYKYLLFIIQ
jgi:hypothetical protein